MGQKLRTAWLDVQSINEVDAGATLPTITNKEVGGRDGKQTHSEISYVER